MHTIQRKANIRNSAATLRVLALNSIFPNEQQPALGVYNACALESLSALAKVRVVAPVKWFPGLALASWKERLLTRVPQSGEYNDLPVTHPRFFRTPGFGLRWHGWMYERSVAGHVARIVAEFRPDVLLASWAYPDGFAARRIGERLGIPVVVKCVGSDVHHLLHERERGPLVLEALRGCTRIVSVSDRLRSEMIPYGIPGAKIDVVYNGVDKHKFHPMPRGEARRALDLREHGKMLVCIGSLLPIKRHCDLLKAFSLLVHSHQIESTLILLGEGPLREPLMRQARDLRIAEHVKFAGECRHEQVPLWINAADLVCLASENEGLPNVLVEALACGRPVVATDVGGIPELICSPNHGRLVPMGDVAALAQALNEVLGRDWDPRVLNNNPLVVSWQHSAAELFFTLQRAFKAQSHIEGARANV